MKLLFNLLMLNKEIFIVDLRSFLSIKKRFHFLKQYPLFLVLLILLYILYSVSYYHTINIYLTLSKGAIAVFPKQPDTPPIINFFIYWFYYLFS